MNTLIIHTPESEISDQKQSFDDTLQKQRGRGFAMQPSVYDEAKKCVKVIILDNISKQKAVAKLIAIEESSLSPTAKNIKRYDVIFDIPLRCQHSHKNTLNKYGVAIIDEKGLSIEPKA
jgi:hypothetical protein